MLSEMYETLQLDPRGVIYDPRDHIITSAPQQLTAYTECGTALIKVGDDESTGVNRPYSMNASDTTFDAGLIKPVTNYNGIGWYTLPTHTNSLVFLTRRSNILMEEFQPLIVEPTAMVDLSDSIVASYMCSLVHLDPYRAARIEALTT
jgi:hypothetical protein